VKVQTPPANVPPAPEMTPAAGWASVSVTVTESPASLSAIVIGSSATLAASSA
jgi:hypothetical protein